MAYSVPPPYAQAVRNGLTLTYTVDATYHGTPVRLGLQPVGGSIVDTIKPGVRRTLSLDLAPEPGLYDALTLFGTVLHVTAHVTYTNQSTAAIPMGVFDIDQSSLDEGGGKLSLTAKDKWVRVERAKFPQPAASTQGASVVSQIVSLLQGALGTSATIVVTATSTARVPALTWDSDRAQAIIDLATSIGAWVYFDRTGTCTVADLPRSSPSADWLIDASASGVMLSLSREQDRTHTFNVVVVDSSASSGAAFPAVTVWDNDPGSPTYAGTDDGTGKPDPATAGPFGVVVYKYTTSTTLDASGAASTARAILTKTTGLTSQATMGSVPNPAIDSFDALDVLGPGVTKPVIVGFTPATTTTTGGLSPGLGVFPGSALFPSGGSTVVLDPGGGPIVSLVSSGAASVRHIVDTVTHPLDVTQPQQIQGRSTRTDPYS